MIRKLLVPPTNRTRIGSLKKLLPVVFLLIFSRIPSVQAQLSDCQPKLLLEDQAVHLSQYRGKFLYVDFWASWCGPCRASFPFLNRIHEQYSDDEFVVLGISVDEKSADAVRFVSKNPVNFVLAIDSTGECPTAFNVKVMPSSFLLNEKGEIVFQHRGFRSIDEKKLETKIQEILPEKRLVIR